ncbi:hypothetical protein Neosp_009160 [[Neocosmospora] mangrovei]
MATRLVFATDINNKHVDHSWEIFSAVEVGIVRNNKGSGQWQVVYRTLEGYVWDISQSVTSPDIPADDHTPFTLSRPFDAVAEPKIGFDIAVKFTDMSSTFAGTLRSTADTEVAWRGKSIGKTDAPLSAVLEPQQPIAPAVKTFLEIQPLRDDGKGGRLDKAQAGANDLFRDLMLHAMPKESAGWFARDSSPLGDALKTKLNLSADPIGLKVPVHFSIQKVLDDNRRFLEVAAMHYLCHSLKQAGWLHPEYRDSICDKYDLFWTLLACRNEELSKKCKEYGDGLPVAREASMLRSQYADVTARCYDIAFLWLAKDQWQASELSGNPAQIFDLVKAEITSDDYKNYWQMRYAGSSDQIGAMTVEQRLGQLGDKLRLLQKLVGREDPAEIRSIIEQLAKAAQLSGIARSSLIDAPTPTIVFSLDSIMAIMESWQFKSE